VGGRGAMMAWWGESRVGSWGSGRGVVEGKVSDEREVVKGGGGLPSVISFMFMCVVFERSGR